MRAWLVVVAAAAMLAGPGLAELETVHEWRYLDFLWDSEEQRQAAEYNSSRVLPSDLAVAKGMCVRGAWPSV